MKKSQITIFISLILTILFLAHYVVYEGVLAILNINQVNALRIVFVILWLSFITTQLAAGKFNNLLTKVVYRFAVIWLGFMFYLFLATCIFGIAAAIVSYISPQSNIQIYGQILLGTGLLVALYGLWHAGDTQVTKITIKLANLPNFWQGKKIVWISDVHLGQIRAERFATKAVRIINSLSPDIVFIGGDLYDGVVCDEEKIIAPLKNLKVTLGTYFITGNHDGFSDSATSRDVAAIQRAHIQILRDKLIEIEGLQIIGIDYKNTAKRENYAKVLQSLNINPDKPSILLKHVPNDVDLAAQLRISLQISGHTHRAQVQPLSFIPRLVYKGFDYGLKKLESTQIFTSSGVGTWGPPFRVGTNSEVVQILLEQQ